jgi:hypothetical protein
MLATIKYYVEKIMSTSVYLYKFSVFSFYMYQKYLFPYDDSDSDDETEDNNYYRTHIVDDIENIVPKLE